MRKNDLISSLAFLICGISITLFSLLRISTGTFGNPGSGLFPLITGILLTIIAGIVFITSFRQSNAAANEPPGADMRLGHIKPAATVIIMFLYAITIDWVGFITASLILLFFLYKAIGNLSVKVSIGGSVLTTVIAYLIFKVWLNVQLPTGPLGV